jgi:hypothetical protein
MDVPKLVITLTNQLLSILNVLEIKDKAVLIFSDIQE